MYLDRSTVFRSGDRNYENKRQRTTGQYRASICLEKGEKDHFFNIRNIRSEKVTLVKHFERIRNTFLNYNAYTIRLTWKTFIFAKLNYARNEPKRYKFADDRYVHFIRLFEFPFSGPTISVLKE